MTKEQEAISSAPSETVATPAESAVTPSCTCTSSDTEIPDEAQTPTLLEARSTPRVGHHPVDRLSIHKAATINYNQPVFKELAANLAIQRREILWKAQTLLSREKQKTLGVRRRRGVLDGRAVAVAKQLHKDKLLNDREFNELFPDWHWASSGESLYVLVECNQEAAQLLYDAGLDDVDDVDELGYSPLSLLEIPNKATSAHGRYQTESPPDALATYLSMCEWFKAKGASLNRVSGLTHATPLHHIAGRIGRYLGGSMEERCKSFGSRGPATISRRFANDCADIIKPLSSSILRDIWKDMEHHDLYACPCALGGCLAFNVLINETIKRHRSPTVVSLMAVVLVKKLIDASVPAETRAQQDVRAPIVLRACTFACLGLAHSCRSSSLHRFRRMSGEERRRASDATMDGLVAEFEAKYLELKLPLWDFFTEWWLGRMYELLG
ncbi:uncharacterized protein BJX67DRAFT_234663 [Aspergillus lucknowensis]|uniref:Uncharacterized protein n=1 Tax=Aspergillus lucknowensis TaxID=176173 RepID=A0ABR4LI49_9EURO